MEHSVRAGPVDMRTGMPVLRCGQQRWAPGTAQRGFCVGQYAVVWVEEGSCTVQYPGREPLPVVAGEAFKRFPDERHDVFSDEGCFNRFLAVPVQVCELLDICRVPGWRRRRIRPGHDPAVADGFRSLRDELERQAGGELMHVLCRMQAFIAELHRRDAIADPRQAPIREACELLREREGMSVPAVAAAVGLPYSSFRQRFQQVVGCSPRSYRIRSRIEQAQGLLLRGLAVAEVAERLAYCDAFRFSAQFKQATGLSPSAWRARELGT